LAKPKDTANAISYETSFKTLKGAMLSEVWCRDAEASD